MADDLFISGLYAGYGTSSATTATIKSEIDKTGSFKDILQKAVDEKDEKQLRKACTEFESYFIQTLFKEMRKTVNSEGGLLPQSNAQSIFQGMLDEEYAKNAANGKGIGIADMIYKQMTRNSI